MNTTICILLIKDRELERQVTCQNNLNRKHQNGILLPKEKLKEKNVNRVFGETGWAEKGINEQLKCFIYVYTFHKYNQNYHNHGLRKTVNIKRNMK